jgi:predicted ATPase
MQYTIEIKNIGIIDYANVEFGHLTVIAGENDRGKSTVGKLLYSIIKSIGRYEKDLEIGEMDKIRNITSILFEISSDINNAYRRCRDRETMYKIREIKVILYKCIDHLKKIKAHIRLDDTPYNTYDDDKLKMLIKDLRDRIINLGLSKDIKLRILKKINEIKKIINKKLTKEEMIKKAFDKIIKSEFYGELSKKDKEDAYIKILGNEELIMEINLYKNKLKNFKLNSNFLESGIFYNDAVYVETPTILHIHRILDLINIWDHKEEIMPFHIMDLIAKLKSARFGNKPSLLEEEDNKMKYKIIKEISSIIEGDVDYLESYEDFVYFKGLNKNKKRIGIRSVNIASGIKSFGILQLLAKSDYLDKNILLVIDEPEIHLHPKWQVKYAYIIVKMVKYGVPIIISSHSPYMIQALKYFAIEEGIIDVTRFYLAEKENNNIIIKNVDEEINKIFRTLAQPLREIVWGMQKKH